jgi:hypothetical protein
MNPRVEYEMTQAQLDTLLEACRSTPVIKIGNYIPASPQENANRAWAALGKEMGFEPMTARPVQGKGERFFTAVSSETQEQRAEREAREAQELRQYEIERHTAEIAKHQAALAELEQKP